MILDVHPVHFPDVTFSKAIENNEKASFMCHVLPDRTKVAKEPRDWIRKKIEPSWEISDSFISKYISMKREEIQEGNKKEDGVDLLTFYINEDD